MQSDPIQSNRSAIAWNHEIIAVGELMTESSVDDVVSGMSVVAECFEPRKLSTSDRSFRDFKSCMTFEVIRCSKTPLRLSNQAKANKQHVRASLYFYFEGPQRWFRRVFFHGT